MTIVKANDVELTCDSFGEEADEPLLLIAGLGTQMIRWTVPFCEALARCGYRVIRFDNRDSGRSTHFHHCATPDFAAMAAALRAGQLPDVPYTLQDMAADAIGLLDALAIDRAHVVGRSMGGMIAQIIASEHPERVLSLTSIMSSSGNPMLPQAAPDAMAMMMRPAPDPVSDEAGFIAHKLAFARRIAGSGHAFDEQANRLLILEETRRAYDPGGSGRQIAAMAVTGDRRSRLATITAPTLVIHGADDPLFLPACGRDTAASIPNADLMLIDGMGHDLPPALYRAIVEAIDRTASRSIRNVAGKTLGCESMF
jgi:pimeloyl-ACP methyl ester carboxylesterase